MSKRTTESIVKSSPEWGELEDWLRGSMQKLIQETLEEEVTGFFGRVKSARRSEEDSDSGYRNGYARPRKLTLSGGTIELRMPRVRNTAVLTLALSGVSGQPEAPPGYGYATATRTWSITRPRRPGWLSRWAYH